LETLSACAPEDAEGAQRPAVCNVICTVRPIDSRNCSGTASRARPGRLCANVHAQGHALQGRGPPQRPPGEQRDRFHHFVHPRRPVKEGEVILREGMDRAWMVAEHRNRRSPEQAVAHDLDSPNPFQDSITFQARGQLRLPPQQASGSTPRTRTKP
jgi:hypothetical protein